MNRLAPLACALSLVMVLVTSAWSQVPHITAYFEGDPTANTFYGTNAVCKPPGTIQNIYIVLENFNMHIWAVELSVDYPHALFHLQDIYPADALTIGSSNANWGVGGLAIAWFAPQNAYEPLLAFTSQVVWTSPCDCNELASQSQPLSVRGYRYNAYVGARQDPRVVRWPDFVEIDGVGVTSIVCSTGHVPTEQTTWGRVKALYR